MSKYTLFLITLAITILAYWVWNYDPRVNELNSILSQDNELNNYPYQFKVIELKNGTAVMSSPRSAKVSVFKFLSIIKPNLPRNNSNNPKVIAAQKELAYNQQKAKKIILSQSDIEQVSWKLDKNWFASYGIYVDD